MITLHDKKETDFQKNGYGILDSIIFNETGSWELNNQFKISFEIPALSEIAVHIKNKNIVQAPVPFMDRQLFRIYRIEKTLTSIYVEARHIFYDLLDNWIEKTKVINQTGNAAIQQLLTNTQYPHNFIANSNINKVSTADFIRVNPIEAILDDSKTDTFLHRWGGELVRDNFKVEMIERMGADRGVKIEYKKDLLGYSATFDFSTIVTRIQPVGFDGLMLPEKYVDSPLLDPVHPIVSEVEYQDIKAAIGKNANDEEAVPIEEAYKQLRKAAKDEFDIRHVDEPETVIEVDFVTLHNTEQYKGYEELQEVRAGDTVSVLAYDHGFEITSRLVSFEFSLLKENQYTKTTLGNHVYDFTTSEPDVKDLRERIEEAEKTAVLATLAANGRNRNFYGSEDPNTVGLDSRVGDLYFLENGEKESMYRYVEFNGERYWKKSIDKDTEQNKQAIVEQEKKLKDVETSTEWTLAQIKEALKDGSAISLKKLFANKIDDENFGTLFYQNAKNVGIVYEEGGDMKAIIALQENVPYIKGEHIMLDGDTIIDGTFTITEEMIAENAIIDQLKTSGIDANDINVINLNMDSISGGNIELSKGFKITNNGQDVLSVDSSGKMVFNVPGIATEEDISIVESNSKNYIEKAIDELNINGANLLNETSGSYRELQIGNYSSLIEEGNIIPVEGIGLKAGDVLTYSVYIKAPNSYGGKARLTLYSDELKNGKVTAVGDLIKGKSEGLSFVTYKLTEENLYIEFAIENENFEDDGSIIEYKEAKVEKGAKPTSWSASGDDWEAALSNKADREYAEQIETDLNDFVSVSATREELGEVLNSLNEYVRDLNIAEVDVEKAKEDIANLLTSVPAVEKNLGEFTEKWSFVGSYMYMGDDGFYIGEKSSSTGIRITTDRIDFMDGAGEPVAHITNQLMKINRGIFVKSATIGEHLIETVGDGVTVWTWVDKKEESE